MSDRLLELEAIHSIDETILQLPLPLTNLQEDQIWKGSLAIEVQLPEQGIEIEYRIEDGTCLGLIMTHLPPLQLCFETSPMYPMKEAPNCRISCPWLPSNLAEKLLHHLQSLFVPEVPVLLSWMDFCRYDLFPSLISASLPLSIQGPISLVKNCLQWEEQVLFRLFQQSFHECLICLEEKRGSDCHRLLCGHVFCRDCLQSQYQCWNDLSANNVDKLQQMRCAWPDCRKMPRLNDVAAVCNEASILERFEKGLKESKEASLPKCPREGCPGVCPTRDEAYPLLCECAECAYVFCRQCGRVYHALSPCEVGDAAMLQAYDALQAQIQIDQPHLSIDYAYLEEHGHLRALQRQYGPALLKRTVLQRATTALLAETSKKCPKCHTWIERSMGCNHMTCTVCGKHFCWLCGESIKEAEPYDHFRKGNCGGQLFAGTEIENDPEVALDLWIGIE